MFDLSPRPLSYDDLDGAPLVVFEKALRDFHDPQVPDEDVEEAAKFLFDAVADMGLHGAAEWMDEHSDRFFGVDPEVELPRFHLAIEFLSTYSQY